MTYSDGQWGKKEKERSKRRKEYFLKAIKGHRKGNHLKLKGEKIARKILPGAKYVDKSSHDFEWKGKKIEVKYSNPHNGRWYFHITNEQQKKSDYFLLIFQKKRGYMARLVPTQHITQKKCINCTLERYKEFEV